MWRKIGGEEIGEAEGTDASKAIHRWRALTAARLEGATEEAGGFLGALRRSSFESGRDTIDQLIFSDGEDEETAPSLPTDYEQQTKNVEPAMSQIQGLTSQIEKDRPAAPAPTALRPTDLLTKEPVALVVPQSITIKGDVSGADNVVVLGTVNGNLEMPGASVTVARGGRTEGNIRAARVSVQGLVTGEVLGDEVDVKAGGIVNGNISAPTLVLERGSRVDGFVKMENGR